MGGSSYSHKDYTARETYRSTHSIPTFKHDADIRSGAVTAKVHDSLNPKGVKLREARDSDTHPLTMPIGVITDTTGSMARVPAIIQSALPKLMGTFLDAKVSGERYLGDYYPAILIGAVDDYTAVGPNGGALQVGQFESGLEIDDNLTNLWLTGRGGGTYEESYDLALYFFARHTATDHWDKRKAKGYLFIIGDEQPYPFVSASQVEAIIGDKMQTDIPIGELMKEVQERYHVFFVIPNMTNHWGDPVLEKAWTKYLPQQNVIKLDNPEKVCELIASTIAICENHINADDLDTDGLGDVKTSLAVLSKHSGGAVAATSKLGLALSGGTAVERL